MAGKILGAFIGMFEKTKEKEDRVGPLEQRSSG